jgi:hypothetical protein
VAVGGEGVADTPFLHHDEADAIGEAPVLVETLVTQFERALNKRQRYGHNLE